MAGTFNPEMREIFPSDYYDAGILDLLHHHNITVQMVVNTFFGNFQGGTRPPPFYGVSKFHFPNKIVKMKHGSAPFSPFYFFSGCLKNDPSPVRELSVSLLKIVTGPEWGARLRRKGPCL